ncbi:MAG: hypothetical protein VYD64_10995 [Pseudomonadota bacterium]|nr:hypothetical protein [Pseudomonadota bacterium]
MLIALEQSWLAAALKSSFYVYPSVNALHILAIGGLFTSVVLLDLRTLGLLPAQSAAFTPLARRLALGAFAIAAATGLALLSVRATEYAVNPAFRLKLVLIALAGLNFLAFRIVTRKPTGSVPRTGRGLAVLSIMLWTGIALCGRFIAFV